MSVGTTFPHPVFSMDGSYRNAHHIREKTHSGKFVTQQESLDLFLNVPTIVIVLTPWFLLLFFIF